MMKFNLHIPIDKTTPKSEFQNGKTVRELAIAIEEAGADGCYLSEHPAPLADWLHNDPTGHDTLDPFVALSSVAAATTRLMLITNVVVLPYRNPFLTAKAAATLQVVSDGRFILGTGVGYQKGEFDALGVPSTRRGALMDEALETIRLAWAGGAVVKKGMYFDAVGNEPRPIPDPAPPIWVGGGSDKAVERAAAFGDGWNPFFARAAKDPNIAASAVTSMEDLATKVDRLKILRRGMGKTTPFDVAIGMPIPFVEQSAEQAKNYRAAVEEYARAGVTWCTVTLPSPNKVDFLSNLEWFRREVLWNFR